MGRGEGRRSLTGESFQVCSAVFCQWHIRLACGLMAFVAELAQLTQCRVVVMARKTVLLEIVVSPALVMEYERLAEREGTTRSDLFCRIVSVYKAKREEEEFVTLKRKMARCARKTGVFTEEEVERIVFEDR
jgi:hypothetical protein